MTEYLGEFLGTMILLLLGVGVVANVCLKGTKGNNSGWVVICFGWGFAVFAGVLVSKDLSGAHLNPAVTLGLQAAGAISFPMTKLALFIVAQMLGAATGAFLAWLAYKDHYDATTEGGPILATFATGPAIANPLSNFISETIATFVLVFAVLYSAGPTFSLADGTEIKVGLGSLGALPVALIVVSIGLSLGGTTGHAINPARDLAPRVVHALLPIKNKGTSDWGYAWIPVVGPCLGGLLAALVYSLVPVV